MTPGIAVVGSTNWDMSMSLPSLPSAGETINGGHCQFCLGGKGANQAIAAARAGAEVFFLSGIGSDDAADAVRRQFALNWVAEDGLVIFDDTETGKAMIFVDANGENCIGVADGANARLSPLHVAEAAETLTQAKTLVLQLEIPMATVAAAAALGHQSGATVILNPAPAADLTPELLANVSILTPNQTEMAQVCNTRIETEAEIVAAAKVLLEHGPQAIVVTRGRQGIVVVTPEDSFALPAFAAQAVDTTAAGDVFNGALAVALGNGDTLRDAAQFAMAAAALSVAVRGAIPSIPYREQILKKLGGSP